MAASELRVAILGCTGRMGRAILQVMDESAWLTLSGASASAGSKALGQDAGTLAGGKPGGVIVTADPAVAVKGAGVAIDFTLPEALSANLRAATAAKCPLVIGTTGLDADARTQVCAAAEKIPVVLAPNMSLGVNLLLRLVEIAGSALDDSYDVEISEAHHRNKKDAPSGTALELGRHVALSRGVELEEIAQYERQGVRRPGSIGFSVFRGGDVVGDHTVTFAGIGERIELTHRASDRVAFARGAIKAARWIAGRAPGLYSMRDVLGLG
jgi:4-hydroxy-tetrahydrodipicolinate reductase